MLFMFLIDIYLLKEKRQAVKSPITTTFAL